MVGIGFRGYVWFAKSHLVSRVTCIWWLHVSDYIFVGIHGFTVAYGLWDLWYMKYAPSLEAFKSCLQISVSFMAVIDFLNSCAATLSLALAVLWYYINRLYYYYMLVSMVILGFHEYIYFHGYFFMTMRTFMVMYCFIAACGCHGNICFHGCAWLHIFVLLSLVFYSYTCMLWLHMSVSLYVCVFVCLRLCMSVSLYVFVCLCLCMCVS